MSKVIKLRQGRDLPMVGAAPLELLPTAAARQVAVMPSDFKGVTLKPVVSAGDEVAVGTPLLRCKELPRVSVVSPVSGKVASVDRGERRRVLRVVVDSDGLGAAIPLPDHRQALASAAGVREALLATGLWAMIKRRPFGIVADPDETPRDIYVSCADTAPLAPDMAFVARRDMGSLSAGVDALNTLLGRPVTLGILERDATVFQPLANARRHYFSGPHPAGNVGVQIHKTDPIAKGDVVWTLTLPEVQAIGRFFATGKLDFARPVALTGERMLRRGYAMMPPGARLSAWLGGNIDNEPTTRVISGSPLTGAKAAPDGFLGFHDHQVTAIPEGDYHEFLGWGMPRLRKFSLSRAYFSWLLPRRQYSFDANTHGDERAFVVTGQYENLLPMDIYPVHLLKAVIARDIDKMEQLGIYEVLEEDLALCEFACTSKIEVQRILREGLDAMLAELR